MNEKDESTFPIRCDPEDEIFVKCMSRIKEFPQYITGYDDIEGPYESRFISSGYRNLNLDSVRIKSDKSSINIEHHSSISQEAMRRNYEYAVNVFNATGQTVYPFIFYTGNLPVDKITYMNQLNYFHPQWFILKEKDGMKRLNNIKYKTDNDIDMHIFEFLDYIWLPKFKLDITIEECIRELVELYNKLSADEFILNFTKECLALWVGRYIKDQDELKYMARCLNMSKIEERPFEESLRGVIFARKLEEAKEEGVEENRIDFISKLLKHMSPQEVSDILELPIESILSVQSYYSK